MNRGAVSGSGRAKARSRRLKLQGIYDGELYASSYRTVYREARTGEFGAVGRLPIPAEGRADLAYRLKTTRPWKPLVERAVGRFPTVNVWRVSDDVFLASAIRWVFRSTDGGVTWTVTRRLPPSSGPMGVLPTAFCQHDGSLYVGEYPLDGESAPRVLRSDDEGHTWTAALTLPEVRHVHAIKRDPYSDDLWMTTGDTGDECRIGRLRNGRFDVVGSGSQHWRAVEPVFAPAGVLWGVDSVYLESNPIYLLRRGEFDRAEPERLTSVDASVYYGASLTVDGDHWVVFSTAHESGSDSTAPIAERVVRTGRATVLAASSASDYGRWHVVASYDKRSVYCDAEVIGERLPSANAYVFLATDDDRGLFVNPYNTRTHDGTVRQYSPGHFRGLE